jgi:DNA repair exonuclease SbcCD nuclease subunit
VPSPTLRLLLLGDTHLGFTPRTRTGEDTIDDPYFSNFERALLPALRGEVDLVIHGGDVFYRSKVKPGLVLRAFQPLKRVADNGIPVMVVPGNHERSAIPYPLLAAHPGIHIFDRPRTFPLRVRGLNVAIAGFPNDRDQIREAFPGLLERTAWTSLSSDIRLLCMHQSIEGATVGPADYVFRHAPDVLPGHAIPAGFAAVLSGHIHRHQILTADLRGRPLRSPVFYAGSTTRTSGAEHYEAKGYLTMEIAPDPETGGRVVGWTRHELSPASTSTGRGGLRPPTPSWLGDSWTATPPSTLPRRRALRLAPGRVQPPDR